MKRTQLRRRVGIRRVRTARFDAYEEALALARVVLRQRSRGRCEYTEVDGRRCMGRFQHAHHRLPRVQGGGNDLCNLLALCWRHHSYVHEHPAESYERGLLLHRWSR